MLSDPFAAFPQEISDFILNQLYLCDFNPSGFNKWAKLGNVRLVCTSWKKCVEGNPFLWDRIWCKSLCDCLTTMQIARGSAVSSNLLLKMPHDEQVLEAILACPASQLRCITALHSLTDSEHQMLAHEFLKSLDPVNLSVLKFFQYLEANGKKTVLPLCRYADKNANGMVRLGQAIQAKTLRLFDSNLEGSHLKQVLKAFPLLETFEYRGVETESPFCPSTLPFPAGLKSVTISQIYYDPDLTKRGPEWVVPEKLEILDLAGCRPKLVLPSTIKKLSVSSYGTVVISPRSAPLTKLRDLKVQDTTNSETIDSLMKCKLNGLTKINVVANPKQLLALCHKNPHIQSITCMLVPGFGFNCDYLKAGPLLSACPSLKEIHLGCIQLSSVKKLTKALKRVPGLRVSVKGYLAFYNKPKDYKLPPSVAIVDPQRGTTAYYLL